MNGSLINTIILALAFLVLFASGELLYHWLKVRAEVTRKYVHIFTGFLTLFFPPMIGNHWFVLLLCASFFLLLIVSMKLRLLPSINAVDRVTRGSLLYPVIVYGCYLLFDHYGQYEFYYIPILILALADPAAELVGKNFPYGRYTLLGHTKTLSGSGGFFVMATIVTLVILNITGKADMTTGLIIAMVIGFTTTLAEGLSHKGYDNLSIPGTAVLLLILLKNWFK